MYNIHRQYYLRKYLTTKIEHFLRNGHKLSHIFEMNFTFITSLNSITYECYLKQLKLLLERRIIEKLARNPKLIKAFVRNISHPLICNFSHTD